MRRVLVAVVLLGACAYAAPLPPREPVGRVERPYTGLPYSLQPKPPAADVDRQPMVGVDERQPVVGHRALPAGERLARLHALLAAVDAHAYTLSGQPDHADLLALELTIDELAVLLAPYPDLEYEVDELRALTQQLPSTPALRRPRVRARMMELTDLIRIQLVAGA